MDCRMRRVNPSVAELLDRLTVDQIKEVLDPEHATSYAAEMAKLEHDLDLFLEEGGVRLGGHLIALVIALAQINLHLWRTKDEMQVAPDRFQECMKLAHQLNGLRNQLKNRILEVVGGAPSERKTNVSTEDLQGWRLSVLASTPGGE